MEPKLGFHEDETSVCVLGWQQVLQAAGCASGWQEVRGKSLYFQLSFAMNLKLQ